MDKQLIFIFLFYTKTFSVPLNELIDPKNPVTQYLSLVENQEIIKKYDFDGPLATGRAFGDIYQVHLKNDPEKIFALKLIYSDNQAMLIDNNPCWMYEKQMELSQKNKNIMPILEAIPIIEGPSSPFFCLVVTPIAVQVFKNELFSADDEENSQNVIGPMNDDDFQEYRLKNTNILKGFLNEIIEGVLKLHGAKFTHNDLKPSNLLLVSDEAGIFHPAINDFDVASDLTPYVKCGKYDKVISSFKGDQQKLKESVSEIIRINAADIISKGIENELYEKIDQGYKKLFEDYKNPPVKRGFSLLRKNTSVFSNSKEIKEFI